MVKLFRNYFGIIIIIVVGFIPLLELFHAGLPITHDGQDHVARIANFYLSLSQGSIVPRWAANLNWGYGHPILMFLYPLPSYLASAFHFLGFSFVDSLKILFGISFIASGLAMYLWIRNVLNDNVAILAGTFYMLAPYRLIDLYVRGAIGEHVAFVFGPLICYLLLKFFKNQKSKIIPVGLSVSIAGLFLSHNAVAIMFLPIAVFYAAYLIYESKTKKLLVINYSIFALLGVGLSAFFLFPAFFEGKYTLRNIVTGSGEYKQGFVNFTQFFIPSWSYGGSALLSKQIGVVQILGLCISLLFIFQKKAKKWRLFFGLFTAFFLGSLILMTPVSNIIWERVSLLQKFQFPWRFLSSVVFTTAIISSLWVFFIKKYSGVFVLAAVFACLVLYSGYFHAQGYINKQEKFYTGIYNSTTDTGESSPIWSVRFMEKVPRAHAEIIDGSGTVTEVSRTAIEHKYLISAKTRVRLRENTVYFPGWKVLVNNKPVDIEFQDPLNRGLITYILPPGESSVAIKFTNTKLRTISDWVSIFSLLTLFFFYFFPIRKLRINI